MFSIVPELQEFLGRVTSHATHSMWRAEDIPLSWITGALVVGSVSFLICSDVVRVLLVFSEWSVTHLLCTPRL